jgi:uncharacterized membrane protein
MCAVAYTFLTFALIAVHGKESDFARALGSDRKGKLSLATYLVAIVVAFFNAWIALALLLAVALVWIVPDSRFAPPGRSDLPQASQGGKKD